MAMRARRPLRRKSKGPKKRAPVKKPPGRPSEFSPAMSEMICELIAGGESLRAVCQCEDMPHRVTVLRWLAGSAEFRSQYARAREAQADFLAEQTIEIADQATAKTIHQARLRFDARRWFAGKVAPKKYGDKLQLGGDGDNPIKIERIERVIVDPQDRDAEEI